jgi:anti-sigma B factor antagonist
VLPFALPGYEMALALDRVKPASVSGQRLLTDLGSGQTAKRGVVVDGFEVKNIATATTTEVDGIVVTRVAGEVDMSSVDVVRVEVTRQLDLRPASLVLDLSALTFIGSSGLTMLIEERWQAQALGVRFVVVADQSIVLQPLEIAGIRDLFTVCPSLPEAIRWLQGHPASE